MIYLGVFLLIINLFGLLLMGYDKRQAKRGGYRVREAHLLGVAFLGAALGGYLGMRLFHHKTQHTVFRFGLPLLMVWNLGAALAVVYYLNR